MLTARNPFSADLGIFTGERLRRARMTRLVVVVLSTATLLAASMAIAEWRAVIASTDACRVTIMDSRGDVFVVGQGDTLAEAVRGAVMPAEPIMIFVEDCDQ